MARDMEVTLTLKMGSNNMHLVTFYEDDDLLIFSDANCSRSRRRAAHGSKRMYLDDTHDLFIT
jgi:hypothetical protein